MCNTFKYYNIQNVTKTITTDIYFYSAHTMVFFMYCCPILALCLLQYISNSLQLFAI